MEEDLRSVLELQNALDETVAHEVMSRRRRRIPSVAVLPFESLGPDEDLEYFCTGLAEELLTGLGKVPGLRVASRTSSFHVNRTGTDIKHVCRLLDVDAALEGTVRKAGDRVRISAQLVSAEDGCHLWSEGYDRSTADVFAVQDEIARSVVDRLKVTLAEFPRQPLIRQHTQNPASVSVLSERTVLLDAPVSRRAEGGARTIPEGDSRGRRLRARVRRSGGRVLVHGRLLGAEAAHAHSRSHRRPSSGRSRSTPICRRRTRRWRSSGFRTTGTGRRPSASFAARWISIRRRRWRGSTFHGSWCCKATAPER